MKKVVLCTYSHKHGISPSIYENMDLARRVAKAEIVKGNRDEFKVPSGVGNEEALGRWSQLTNGEENIEFEELEVVDEKQADDLCSDYCESCDERGYLEVTHQDNCEYIEACENCNGFTQGSHCDATGADERAREQAIKDGYKLTKAGKIK